jgi:hypothetical protein
VFTVLMAWYGHRCGFLLLLIGVFLSSDQPILTAAVLDVIGCRVTTTTIGCVSFARFALRAPSPVMPGGPTSRKHLRRFFITL